MTTTRLHDDTFATATAGLPVCAPTPIVELRDGDTYELRIAPVANRIGDSHVRMLGFNGSVPGPTLRVAQGSEVSVRVRNDGDHDTTVHWHGLRLDNVYDGVPHETQDPIAVGGEFTYRLRFPDDGVYWYHPHVREDVEQPLGLYGNLMVDAPDSSYWSPANREQALMLSDLLMQADTLIPYGGESPDFALMGRVGNVLLVNGEPGYALRVHRGEVVRFALTNAAASRTFNLSFGGAPIKLLGSDLGRFEREAMVPSVVLAPAERYIVEARFARPGRYPLVNAVQAVDGRGGAVAVTCSADPAWLRLHVQDDGPGVPPELRAKIFEPLFTTKARGIGLGLAVSRSLAENNGGALTLDDSANGARFTLALPVHPPAEAP